MTIDVVVARFNEDLTWSDALFRPRLFVYNKGEGDEPRLPNVGREANTYFHHIVKHYDSLPEWTFFTQGDPNRHMPFSLFQGIVNGFPRTAFRSALWMEDGPIFFVNHPVLYVKDKELGDDEGNDVKGMWGELFSSTLPAGMVFAPAAIFVISRAKLYTRTSAFYERAMALAVERSRGPWEFERIWAYLWRDKDTPRF